MRWTRSSLAAAALLLIAGGVGLALRDDPPATARPHASAPPPASALPDLSLGAEPEAEAEPEIPSGPELARYRETIAFRDAVRAFFDGYRDLAKSERTARAAQIEQQLEERERDGRVLPQEALVLRLGLLRATIDDPAVLESESRRVLADYRAAAERAAADRAPDPRDAEYEARQAVIAREVMALEEVPGGLAREEYLRERLRELRLEVYADGARER
jgi:hypothetical protein